jgi:hypothetical protein
MARLRRARDALERVYTARWWVCAVVCTLGAGSWLARAPACAGGPVLAAKWRTPAPPSSAHGGAKRWSGLASPGFETPVSGRVELVVLTRDLAISAMDRAFVVDDSLLEVPILPSCGDSDVGFAEGDTLRDVVRGTPPPTHNTPAPG